MKKNELLLEITPYDGTEFLDTEERRIAYLNAELAEGDPVYIKRALQNIARARSMEKEKRTNLTRTSAFRALSNKDNPEYTTIQKVVNALDMQLVVVPKGAHIEYAY